MHFSSPSLHAHILRALDHREQVRSRLETIFQARPQAFAEALPASIEIPLTTVSLNTNFDAFIDICFKGSATRTALLVDSGNSCLIVPDYEFIASLPNFDSTYKVVAQGVAEPWGCPANILRGPIQLTARDGRVVEIPECVFFACTAPNQNNERTANFGTGCISPWMQNGSTTLQAPLSYNTAFPYAQFDYAPTAIAIAAGSGLTVGDDSLLVLHNAMPDGYRAFDIIRGSPWMSLVPRALSIGNSATSWPGTLQSAIAMIDTGGGPVFLSDPDARLYAAQWSQLVGLPFWIPGSISCQAVADDLTIELGDANGSFSYQIRTSLLPAAAQGLTLVMCQQCWFMMGQNGMNIGGLSALFNSILIDYRAGKVGFRPKEPVTE
jgi:hypothetical protein